MEKYIIIVLLYLSGLQACVPPPSSSPKAAVDEDLSKYRLNPEQKEKVVTKNPGANTNTTPALAEKTGELSGDINREMEDMRKQIAESNKNIKTSQGFRVQVYSGQSREEANKIIQELYRYTPDRGDLSYTQPNYRVRIGNYLNRADAYKTYMQIRPAFPNAIIVPDKVDIEAIRTQILR